MARAAALACGARMLSVRVSGRGSSRSVASEPSSCRTDMMETKPTPRPARTACLTPSTPASSSPTAGASPALAKARSTSPRTPGTRLARDLGPGRQVAQRGRAVARQRVVGAHDRHHLVLAPGVHHRIGGQAGRHFAFDESQVQGRQPLDDLARIAVRQMHADGRVAGPEGGHQAGQQVAGRRGAGAQAQRTGFQAAPGVAQRAGLAVYLAQLARVLGQPLAGRGQDDAMAAAPIQRLAEPVLQHAQLAGHRRLRQVQQFGGAADIAGIGHAGEGKQLLRCHADIVIPDDRY